jgi:hypothetical protein
MSRLLVAGAVLVWCLASIGHAQTGSRPHAADSTDVLVLDHAFTAANEAVRVFLQEGQVYRAELSSPDMSLELRGVVRTEQLPRIYPFLKADTPSGTSIVEIYPENDAEYEIRSVGLGGSWVGTRLRLYRDVSASRRRYHVRNTPGWDIGIEVAGGWHSGFAQSSSLPSPGNEPAGGTDIEACFTARSGRRFAMCVMGLDYQSQRRSPTILWVYTEPRVGILGGVRPGQPSWDVGALLRFGVGLISGSPATPTVLGPGLYVARHLRTSSTGAGWTVQASYSHAYFRGFARSFDAVGETVTPKSHRVTFGAALYR